MNHDIDCMGISGDKYFQRLIQLLEQEPISDEYKAYIGGNVRLLEYGGKLVLLMKIKGLNEPAIYDNAYYQRMGANIDKIEPRQMKELFERFY
ncbi:MAG: hypothetical protein UHN47_12920 [Lachnospiraceae bacterium]|nr:hypothetical protein [Lachnospiraceae bacterium]